MGTFSGKLKEYRMRTGMGLREYCQVADIDFSNYSKYERGVLNPPKMKEALRKITKEMKLSKNEFEELYELALIERGQLTPGLVEQVEEKGEMAVFLRKIGNSPLTKEKLEKLLRYIDSHE